MLEAHISRTAFPIEQDSKNYGNYIPPEGRLADFLMLPYHLYSASTQGFKEYLALPSRGLSGQALDDLIGSITPLKERVNSRKSAVGLWNKLYDEFIESEE